MQNDALLLHRYAESLDPEAFADLVKRYAGPVYGTCLRITGNSHEAEDISQECFLTLAQNAAKITSSLHAWLHTVATNQSINRVRKTSVRRKHEKQAAIARQDKMQAAWPDIAPHIDSILEKLPESLRLPLIHHFIEGWTHQEIAQKFSVHRSAITKRIERGIGKLRSELKKAGIITTSAVLMALLAENAATAAPATLVATLGKIAMAGIGAQTAAVGASVGLGSAASAAATFGALKAVIVVTVVVGGLMAGGLAIVGKNGNGNPPAELPIEKTPADNLLVEPVREPQPIIPAGSVRVTLPDGITFVFQKHEAEEGLWVGDNLYCPYPGGQRLVFTREGPKIHLSAEGGPSRLAGICIATKDDLETLRSILEEMPGPLTVGCSSLFLSRLLTLPHLEEITSLSIGQGEGGPPLTRSSIELLAKLKGVSSLRLSGGIARDISALAELPALRKLVLYGFRQLSDISPLAKIKGLTSLKISECRKITDISALSDLTNLTSLKLDRYFSNIDDISSLAPLSRLSRLEVSARHLEDISSLSALTNLTELDLHRCPSVSDLSALHKLNNLTRLSLPSSVTDNDLLIVAENNHQTLTSLSIARGSKITDLSPLSKLSNLQQLEFSGEGISNLSPLSGLSNVNRLVIQYCPEIRSLDAIANFRNLSHISLKNTGISDLSPLSGFSNLTYVELEGSKLITDFSVLGNLKQLESLQLVNCRNVTDLSWLVKQGGKEGASKLELLWIFGCPNLADLSALKHLDQLRYLDLRISDLTLLSGLKEMRSLEIRGSDGFTGCREINELSPLAAMKKLKYLSCVGFKNVTDLTPVADIHGLHRVYLLLREPDVDPSGVRKLLLNGVNVDISGNYWREWPELSGIRRRRRLGNDFAGLLDAINNDDLHQARQLLEKDPGLANYVDEKGKTPLLHVRTMSIEMVELLLENGANPNVSTDNGYTPLHLTARPGNNNEEKTQSLLAFGADSNATDDNGRTPLDWAMDRNAKAEITLLKKEGAKEGIGEINRALNNGDVPRLCKLLELRPELATAEVKGGQPAIHRAAKLANIEILSVLLNKGVPIDLRDKQGTQPIHQAVDSGNKEAVSFFLEKGVSVNTTVDSRTFTSWYGGSTPLHIATRNNDVDMLKFLLGHEPKADVREQRRGKTPLHIAAEKGYTEIIELLLKAGVDINVRTQIETPRWGRWQETPLHYAVIGDKEMTVALLLANGADPTLENTSFATPLHIATDLCHTNIADIIRQHVAKR